MAMTRYIKDVINPKTVLDVGCGIGQLVNQLRKLHIDARGLEYSNSFISMSPVKDYIYQGDIQNLKQFEDGSFDLIVCMEVLEHVPPTYLNNIILELKRISKNQLLITTPSYGPNEFGYNGLPLNEEPWIRDTRENIPFKNLVVDETEIPDCGHITLASYKWWTDKFIYNGLVRDPSIENIGYDKYDFLKYRWNLYLLSKLANGHINIKNKNYFVDGLYLVEDWGKIGFIRWTKKDFNIYLMIDKNDSSCFVEFYSGPKELIFNREVSLTSYLLKEENDLKLCYEEKILKKYVIQPDTWYRVPLIEDNKDNGFYKFKFEISDEFLPRFILQNGDNRSLGIALREIGSK